MSLPLTEKAIRVIAAFGVLGLATTRTRAHSESCDPPRRPAFKPFRYDEDFTALADPSLRTLPLDDLKHISLADDSQTYLSIGGEARTRYEYFREPGFGLRGLSRDDFVLQRLLLHADLHLGEHVRVFAQGISAWQLDSESSRSVIQDDRLDVQQAFADVTFGEAKGDSLTIRTGRMEMSFGSSRLVSAREPANVRLNFDGVRAILRTGTTTIDAFLTRPVEQKLGVFNDGEDDAQTFWGLYSSMPVVERELGIDLYYFGLRRENARFDVGTATEERHSLGTRLWGLVGGFDYDVEAVFQFGTFGDRDIRAWTVATNVGYTWRDAPWRPRVGLKANIASGDGRRGDDRLGTFNALFPRQGYFSEINLVAPANFFDVHPVLQLRPRDDLTVAVSWNPFWRLETKDAVYGPRGIAIPASATSGRFVGSTLNVQADWLISTQFSVSAFYAHFFAGEAVSNAGGHSADFVGTWFTFKF